MVSERIRHTDIGQVEMRKLVTVAIAGENTETHSEALYRMMLERARFCELLAPLIAERTSNLYLHGMLCLIDVFMQIPMYTILDAIPIDADRNASLVGEQSNIEIALDCVRCCDSGDRDSFDALPKKLQPDQRELSTLYIESMNWVGRILCLNEPSTKHASSSYAL